MAKRSRPIRAQSLQVSVRMKKPSGIEITPQVIQEAINEYIERQRLPPGFEISLIVWHKEYSGGGQKDYKYENANDFLPVLQAAKRAGILPKVFSRASES